MKSSRWTTTDIPDQTGKTIVVTGANSGLGEQTARALAARGAHVILACRDIRKGEMAAKSMNGHITVAELDLADLASVRRFAEGIEHVEVLVNNAGIMAVPEGRTSDGFESQFGTNFLGHFALTGLLLPRITERVVTLSSLAHRMGTIRLDDPNWKRRTYQRWPAYGQSKLADLMFAYELHRRLAALGSPVRSIAAHPGFSKTELHTHTDAVQGAMIAAVTQLTGQSSAMGALPSLFAATAPDAAAGGYYGPGGPGEVRGYPRPSASSHRSRDPLLAVGLWNKASELTGVEFLVPPPPGRATIVVGGPAASTPQSTRIAAGVLGAVVVGVAAVALVNSGKRRSALATRRQR